jgi:hypothetical protein
VGWKISTSASAGFVLDALEQAIHARRPGPEDGLYKTEVIWRQRSWPSASAVEMASLSEFHGDHLSPQLHHAGGHDPTRQHSSAEDKIRIVLEGLCGEGHAESL